MAHYKLVAVIEGDELELMSSDLYQIDRITTAFENKDAFLEHLFETDYSTYKDYKIDFKVKTPNDNTIETAYSSVRNVIYDSCDSNNFKEFIGEISNNTSNNRLLFNSLNRLINKRILGLKENKFFTEEKFMDLDMNHKYLWDRYFDSKVASDDPKRNLYLSYKEKYNTLNREIALTQLLNILSGNDDIKGLQPNLNTFLRGKSKEEKSSNYRNFRDFYIQIASSYQTKYSNDVKQTIEKNSSTEEKNYVSQVLGVFNRKVEDYIGKMMKVTANITSNYSDLNDEYYNEMKSRLDTAIRNNDEEAIERYTELSKLYEEEPHKNIL